MFQNVMTKTNAPPRQISKSDRTEGRMVTSFEGRSTNVSDPPAEGVKVVIDFTARYSCHQQALALNYKVTDIGNPETVTSLIVASACWDKMLDRLVFWIGDHWSAVGAGFTAIWLTPLATRYTAACCIPANNETGRIHAQRRANHWALSQHHCLLPDGQNATAIARYGQTTEFRTPNASAQAFGLLFANTVIWDDRS